MNEAVIEIQRLVFAYGPGRPTLSVIGMTIANGECVGLVGPNGAGKSTLLLHFNGVLRGRGAVRVLGLDVCRNNLKEIRRRVGLLFQDPRQQLFLPSIEEDIAFGPLSTGIWHEAEARQRVATIMARLQLEEIGAASPLRLSPGEQKRAALATVLVMEPELLAFDEPSAGLDPAGRRDFIELVRALPQTKVIATHDMDLAYELCGRILVMDHGRVVADGPRDAILSDEKLLRAHRLERPLSMMLKDQNSVYGGRRTVYGEGKEPN